MRRSQWNRWWTFALAFVVLAGCVASLPAGALANQSANGGTLGDGNPPGSQQPGTPNPQGSGDPDSPTGRSGSKPGSGASRPGTGDYGAGRISEPGMPGGSGWMLKVRIAMDVFRFYVLRF